MVDSEGWVTFDHLLGGYLWKQRYWQNLTRDHIVTFLKEEQAHAENIKKKSRYELNWEEHMVRAVQGHAKKVMAVPLGTKWDMSVPIVHVTKPPPNYELEEFMSKLQREGLCKMKRNGVHFMPINQLNNCRPFDMRTGIILVLDWSGDEGLRWSAYT